MHYIVRAVARGGRARIEAQIDRVGTIPPSRRFYVAFPVIREKTVAFHTLHVHFRLLFATFRFDEDRTTVRGIVGLPESVQIDFSFRFNNAYP